VGGVHLFQRARLVGLDDAVFLPAAEAHHLVAGLVPGRAAFHHLAGRAALHHLAQRLRLGVALGVVHAAAHVGVQRQEVVAHQDFAVFQRTGLAAHQLEVACDRFALRPVVEMDLSVGGHGVLLCWEISRSK
jgi:hypothetical protein